MKKIFKSIIGGILIAIVDFLMSESGRIHNESINNFVLRMLKEISK